MKKFKTSSEKVAYELAQKTFRELAEPSKPKARSRVWKSPQGYKFLIPWSNSTLLRILTKKWLDSLKSHNYPLNSSKTYLNFKLFDRLEAQIMDSLRSVIANIEEGFIRPTTLEYLKFIGYSQASLVEAKGDVERAIQDNLIKLVSDSNLRDLGINLKDWNSWARNPLNSSKILYFPLEKNRGNYRNLKEIKGKDITYEMLMELINKTDWNLRRLVESLEKKLNQDQKAYQIERARIKGNLKFS